MIRYQPQADKVMRMHAQPEKFRIEGLPQHNLGPWPEGMSLLLHRRPASGNMPTPPLR